MSNPRPPLNYAMPHSPQPRQPMMSLPMLCVGLLTGTAISAVVWTLGWNWMNQKPDAMVGAIVALAGSKTIAGIVLLFMGFKPRGLGIGLLISLVLGFLIFFGNCTLHL